MRRSTRPYGWYRSKEDENGPVAVFGVRARVLPDMLPADFEVGGFQESLGFPPQMRDAQGAVSVEGLAVPVPGPAGPVTIEIQIGYEVTGAGREPEGLDASEDPHD